MLLAFYGGDPMMWLRDVPVFILRWYHAQMPRVEAKQALEHVERTQIATGRTTKVHGAAKIKEWYRALHGGRMVKGPKLSVSGARQSGIAVRTVKRLA